MDADADPE